MVRINLTAPMALKIGQIASKIPGGIGIDSWLGWKGSKVSDLTQVQPTDSYHSFRRKDYPRGRLDFIDIHPNKMQNVVVTPPQVLKTEQKKAATVKLRNDTDSPQSKKLKYVFSHWRDTLDKVTAGFEITSKTTIGTGQASAVNVQQEFTAKVSSEWTKQTGMRDTATTESEFPVVVPPRTEIRAWITWNESTIRRHIRGDATFECGVRLGQFWKKRRYDWGKAKKVDDWFWSGAKYWSSLSDLALVLEGKSPIAWDMADYFYQDPRRRPSKEDIEYIREGPSIPYDQIVEYKDADDISVDYDTVQEL